MTNWKNFFNCWACLGSRKKNDNFSSKGKEKELDSEVINQIKDFDRKKLTNDQKLLIEQLVPNKELRDRYTYYGLCFECQQPNTGRDRYNFYGWCQSCNSKHFQQNFSNWSSGSEEVDKFIQKTQSEALGSHEVLEWIPYERFTDVKYLAKGGFGTVWKAKWVDGTIEGWNLEVSKWLRRGEVSNKVALKILNDSQNIKTDFLQEISYYKLTDDGLPHVVACYGISRDPETNNYIMVMKLIESDLRRYLKNNYNELEFEEKFHHIWWIAMGLKRIHQKGLIHKDFHSGNILTDSGDSLITDLGLCRPANYKKEEGKIFGVLPYIAPEVLKGKPYSQASDIYSFGIVAWEILSGLPPYHGISHNSLLKSEICNEKRRPEFRNKQIDIKIPQLLEDIIKRCWDDDPLKRPSSDELSEVLTNCIEDINNERDTEFYHQYKEIENNEISLSSLSYETHPEAIYTSRDLTELQISQESQIKIEENDSLKHNLSIEVSPKQKY